MTSRRKTGKVTIDVDKACDLWRTHRNWAAVAGCMLRPEGKPFSAMSVYLAVWRAGRLPEGSRRLRPYGAERDMTESALGHIWRPLKPKQMKMRPCYKTNTVRPNEIDGPS